MLSLAVLSDALTQVWQALHVFDQLGCVSNELLSREYTYLIKFDWDDNTLQVFASHLCHYLCCSTTRIPEMLGLFIKFEI